MAEIEIQLANKSDIDSVLYQLSNIRKDVEYIMSLLETNNMQMITQKEGELNG